MQILNTKVEKDDELTITTHTVNALFTLACGATTTLTAISIVEDEYCTHVAVLHTNDKEGIELALYNNNAEQFEALISKALNKQVGFTESGMQDNGYASMEF